MRKVLFIIIVGALIFACNKENFEDVINVEVNCEKNIYEYTEPFDFTPHDSMSWYANNGWDVNNAETPIDYPKINLIKINPNNSFQFLYTIITTQGYAVNRELFKYDFCSNNNTLMTTEYYVFDWTKKDKIYYNSNLDWGILYKMDSNGTNNEIVATLESPCYWIESSPNGELIMVEMKEFGLRVFTILTEDGEEISDLEGNGFFLGWYDNEHLLIQYDGEVRKVNVYNENEELYLTGTYHHYDPISERFLKKRVVDGFENWQTLNKNGVLLNETQPHIQSGFFLFKPHFLDENRIISMYNSREYSPSLNSMLIKEKAIIMNLDGSNARRVTPFEE